MVSVPNRIWTKRGPLNPSEWERVRLHAHHSQRILSLAAPLRESATLAGLHHERLDGSGYHGGVSPAAPPLSAPLLPLGVVSHSITALPSTPPPLPPPPPHPPRPHP